MHDFSFFISFDFFFYDRLSDNGTINNKHGVWWVGSGLLSFVCNRKIIIEIIITIIVVIRNSYYLLVLLYNWITIPFNLFLRCFVSVLVHLVWMTIRLVFWCVRVSYVISLRLIYYWRFDTKVAMMTCSVRSRNDQLCRSVAELMGRCATNVF